MDTGEWTETVMPEQMFGLTTAMGEATDATEPGARAPSEDACSVIADWVVEARSAPVPTNDAIAAAYAQYIDAGEAYGKDACPSTDQEKILAASEALHAALNAMKEAIKGA